MTDRDKRKRTPEERAAIVARDLRLQRGLIAKDRALTAEAFAIVRVQLGEIARKRARWLLTQERWPDACQAVFALLSRWQDGGEGTLREGESLYFLAQRALKQVADEAKSDKKWAQLSYSLQAQPPRSIRQAELEEEIEVAVHAPQHPEDVERRVAALEEWSWICKTSERLSEDDQKVLVALGDVESGQAESLGAALGIADGAARVRKHRMLERLAAAAITEGNREMARRCAGQKYAGAMELLHVEDPQAAHRIEELRLLRDGELETAKKIELEKHVEGCPGCKRTLRTIERPEEPTLAFVPLVVPDFDFSRYLPKAAPRGRTGKAIALGAAVVAAIVALAWWLAPSRVEPPPPVAKPTPAVPRRPRPRPMAAPRPPEENPDGGG